MGDDFILPCGGSWNDGLVQNKKEYSLLIFLGVVQAAGPFVRVSCSFSLKPQPLSSPPTPVALIVGLGDKATYFQVMGRQSLFSAVSSRPRLRILTYTIVSPSPKKILFECFLPVIQCRDWRVALV